MAIKLSVFVKLDFFLELLQAGITPVGLGPAKENLQAAVTTGVGS